MQKTLLGLILCSFIFFELQAQDLEQQKLVNQFSSTLVYSLKNNDTDTLQMVYPSLQDVKDFLELNSIDNVSEEDWNGLVAERAEDLEFFIEDFGSLIDAGNEGGFNWENAEVKNVSFEMETEVGEVEGKEVRLDMFFISIFMTDGEQNLAISFDEAIVLSNAIKIIEISNWNFTE